MSTTRLTTATGPATVYKSVSTPHHQVRLYTRPFNVHFGLGNTAQIYTSRAASALIGNTLTAPFHVVQTLAQVGSKEGRKSYAQIIDDLWRKEGITAFFRGSVVGAVRFLGTASLNYLIYLGVRKLLADKEGVLTLDNHTIANAASIILSSILTFPLETIRTRLILDFDHRKYKGAIDCLTDSIAREGLGALFQGSILAAVGNYLMIEVMERIWLPIRVGLDLVTPSVLEAAFQSIIAQTLYYPIDTIIKMVQAPAAYKSLHPDVEFNGVTEAATATIAKHGILSLWRGYSVAALQVAPYIAIVSLSFQGTSQLFAESVDVAGQIPARVTASRI